jgi:chaperonin cofactor prefoldin
MAKKEVEAEKGKNVLNDPEERKKLKSSLSALTHEYQLIDDRKEAIKETIDDLSKMYGLDKKVIRKMSTTMYKHNYSDVLDEMNHFCELYETLIEGKLRGDNDPLDADEEGSGSGEE